MWHKLMDIVQSRVDHEPKLTTSRLINLAKRGWTLDLSQTDCESKSQVQAGNPYKGSQAWQKPKHTKASQDMTGINSAIPPLLIQGR